MAYGGFCPGPSHLLKPEHPRYNPDNSYEDFTHRLPAGVPELSGDGRLGRPVEYRPDDIVVMRRNPYYWKVDSDGNQLPYLDEMHYRLSTWADRDVQAAAGTGDYSNLEQPENYVEALQRAAEPDAPCPARVRAAHHRLLHAMNFSGRTAGATPTSASRRSASSTATSTSGLASPQALDRQSAGRVAS
jgi:peptide/nickel transport system substrate-binding protein